MLYFQSEATPVRSEPFDKLRTGYAAAAAKSKSVILAGLLAFDFTSLRSGQTVMGTTASEEVYECHGVRFRDRSLPFSKSPVSDPILALTLP